MLLKKPTEVASNLPLVRANDGFENHEECNEATASVAEVCRELLEFPDAIARSTTGEIARVGDSVVTMGEFVRLHCRQRTKR